VGDPVSSADGVAVVSSLPSPGALSLGLSDSVGDPVAGAGVGSTVVSVLPPPGGALYTSDELGEVLTEILG